MTSAELRAQKQAFVSSVRTFLETYGRINSSAKAVNKYLTATQDTLLNNEIAASSSNISAVSSKTMASISSQLPGILANVDKEIDRLETEERLARLRALEKEREAKEPIGG